MGSKVKADDAASVFRSEIQSKVEMLKEVCFLHAIFDCFATKFEALFGPVCCAMSTDPDRFSSIYFRRKVSNLFWLDFWPMETLVR